MKQELYRDYYLSSDWQHIKNAFLRKHGKYCDLCKAINRIEVHHINYDQEPGTERYQDLMAVCNKCHNDLHVDLECIK